MGVKDRLATTPVVGTALRVQDRYTADAADPLAAAIGFFGFLSLVPLLLLAVSAVGFVLDDPDRQVEVALAVTDALPGFGQTLEGGDGDSGVAALLEGVVERRGTIGVVGLLLLLPTGLKVVNGAMVATRVVLRGRVLKGLGVKVRQLLAMVGLGALAIAAAGASSFVGTLADVLPAPLPTIVALAATFVLDLALFLGAYVLLSPTSTLSARDLLPGAVLGAVGWAVLKVAGAAYVSSQVDSAGSLYGALGGVVALLLLLYLAGRLYLYGAELSAVLVERRQGPLRPPPDPDAPAGAEAPRSSVAERGPSSSDRPTSPSQPAVVRSKAPVARPARAAPATGSSVDEHGEARTAVVFGLAALALAAAWRWLGPDGE